MMARRGRGRRAAARLGALLSMMACRRGCRADVRRGNMAADTNRRTYTYRGEEGEVIPRGATHVIVAAKVIPARAFCNHPNIEVLICHDGVEKIEHHAFQNCPRLRKVVMPGVLVVEYDAFQYCPALTDVEVKLKG